MHEQIENEHVIESMQHYKTSTDFQSSEKESTQKSIPQKDKDFSLTIHCMIASTVELMILPCILQSDHQVCR